MLQLDRHRKIYDYLKENKKATVNELAEICDVAPMTIRRDLDKLEEDKLVTRVFGGALFGTDIVSEAKYEEKEKSFITEKESIAKEAAKLVKDNFVVVLDAGTTCMEIAKQLIYRNNIRVVTTDIMIAAFLMKYKNVEVYCTGGKVQSQIGTCMDEHTLTFLSEINGNISFIGASSIDDDLSLYSFTREKALMKQAIMKSSRCNVLVTDGSKFDKRSFAKVCDMRDFDFVIVDNHITSEIEKQLETEEINYKIV